jgi:microcystin-dependent protein
MSISVSYGNSSTGSTSSANTYELELRVSALEDQMVTTYKVGEPIPATAIASGVITNEEFLTLDGIKTTSSSTIQKQIDAINTQLSSSPGTSNGPISEAEYLTLDGINTANGSTIQLQINTINTELGRLNTLLGSGSIVQAEFTTLDGISTNKTIQFQLNTLSNRCSQLEDHGSSSTGNVPTGTIFTYGGDISDTSGNSAPAGYLRCIGQKVKIADYQSLFNIIGDTYLYGRTSQTSSGGTRQFFFIPDFSGVFIRGEGGHTVFDNCTGLKPGQFQHDKTQKHAHTYNMPADTKTLTNYGGGTQSSTVWDNNYSTDGRFTTSNSHDAYYNDYTPVAESGGFTLDANETRPKNISLCYIIKT